MYGASRRVTPLARVLSSSPRATGRNTTCAVADISVAAEMSTSAPTRNLVSGPVTAAASSVDTVVIDTDKATSPLAMRVTRFEAVPPAERGEGGGGGKKREREAGGYEVRRMPRQLINYELDVCFTLFTSPPPAFSVSSTHPLPGPPTWTAAHKGDSSR